MFLILLTSVLTLSGDLVNPPFAYVRKRREVGFEIDLAREIAKKLDAELQFGIEGDLKVGGGTSDEPYMMAPLTVLVDTQRRPQITSFADVKGKIGVQGFGKEIAEQLGEVINYPKERTIDAIVDLTSGKIDAFLMVKPAALYLSFSSMTVEMIDEVPGISCPLGFDIQSVELREKVKVAQKELVEEGVFDTIYRKWFGIDTVSR